mmetsp:Transcript_54420/g.65600  ORF Transcript_54420/g.65600 Transcript_54420/m.65600 type:complete len:92 (-) Transcript_54420:265-540(-)
MVTNINDGFFLRAIDIIDGLAEEGGKTPAKVWSGDLRRVILKFQAAKMRLYVYPNPCWALAQLKEVRDVLLLYYDKDRNIVSDLEDCMRGM